jgi:hypothetical protein
MVTPFSLPLTTLFPTLYFVEYSNPKKRLCEGSSASFSASFAFFRRLVLLFSGSSGNSELGFVILGNSWKGL